MLGEIEFIKTALRFKERMDGRGMEERRHLEVINIDGKDFDGKDFENSHFMSVKQGKNIFTQWASLTVYKAESLETARFKIICMMKNRKKPTYSIFNNWIVITENILNLLVKEYSNDFEIPEWCTWQLVLRYDVMEESGNILENFLRLSLEYLLNLNICHIHQKNILVGKELTTLYPSPSTIPLFDSALLNRICLLMQYMVDDQIYLDPHFLEEKAADSASIYIVDSLKKKYIYCEHIKRKASNEPYRKIDWVSERKCNLRSLL